MAGLVQTGPGAILLQPYMNRANPAWKHGTLVSQPAFSYIYDTGIRAFYINEIDIANGFSY
jgi:hypothetical protein